MPSPYVSVVLSHMTHDSKIVRQDVKPDDQGRAKGMMAERLAVSEGKLMKLHHDQVIKILVAAKRELAKSRIEALENHVRSTALQETACAALWCLVAAATRCSD